MPNRNGAGSMLVRAVNGAGILGVLTVVALGAYEWKDMESMKSNVANHMRIQEAWQTEQGTRDRQQDEAVNMMNSAMIRIEVNTQNMQTDLDEIKDILRGKP